MGVARLRSWLSRNICIDLLVNIEIQFIMEDDCHMCVLADITPCDIFTIAKNYGVVLIIYYFNRKY